MKLTNREKKMLLGLIVVVLLGGYLKFVIMPQSDKINEAKATLDNKKEDLIKIRTIVASEHQLNEREYDLKRDITNMGYKYFSSIQQEQLIVIINSLLQESAIDVSSISFSNIARQDLDGIYLETMTINLPFEGEYQEIMSFLEKLRRYDKRIIVKNVDMSNGSKGKLTGSLAIDFYSVPNLLDSQRGHMVWSRDGNYNKNPFEVFDEYQGDDVDEYTYSYNEDFYGGEGSSHFTSSTVIEVGDSKVLVEDFEDSKINFMSSHRNGKGNVVSDTNSKTGNLSARLDFDFPPIREVKQAYVLLDDRNLVIKEPPNKMGLWVYSFKKSDHSIILRAKSKTGEDILLTLANDINWTGWTYLETSLPQNKQVYPLKIDRLFVEVKSHEREQGTFLFDSLTAYYDREITDDPVINSSGNFIHYEVQPGDTIRSISMKFYNNYNRVNDIMKYNNIKSNDVKPGRLLILPKN